MYAVICRELLPPREAGAKIGLVVSATIFGMAFGGYFSGVIFDLTSSYRMAFLNGVLWNARQFRGRRLAVLAPAKAVAEAAARGGRIVPPQAVELQARRHCSRAAGRLKRSSKGRRRHRGRGR